MCISSNATAAATSSITASPILEEVLDPKQFYKLNRSFITHFDAIQNIVNLSKSRMKVELTPAARREIIVSSENTAEFKLWLNQ